nr:ribosomal protein L32 [Trentepohlia sp. BN17]UIB38726.1 ribosomal protein L32 [Trentepohlia sp. BN17]
MSVPKKRSSYSKKKI